MNRTKWLYIAPEEKAFYNIDQEPKTTRNPPGFTKPGIPMEKTCWI